MTPVRLGWDANVWYIYSVRNSIRRFNRRLLGCKEALCVAAECMQQELQLTKMALHKSLKIYRCRWIAVWIDCESYVTYAQSMKPLFL
jgi:hypothetical protein